jgi:thiol-disulfide isomerase/thioredoxin
MRNALSFALILVLTATATAQDRAIVAQARPDPAAARFDAVLTEALTALAKSGGYTVSVESRWGAASDQHGPKGGGRYQLTWHDGKYRVEMRSLAAKSVELVSVHDGSQITTYFPAGKLYSQHPTGSPQAGLENNKMLALSLQGSALDILLAPDIARAVHAQATAIKDHGQDTIGGVKAHRFELVWAGAKVELWFAAEGPPLLLQFIRTTSVPTAADQNYEMVCHATFQWQLAVTPDSDAFVLHIPADAKRVTEIYDALAGHDASTRIGTALPKIELANLDGSDIVLAAVPDKKATVVVFWATWCAASVEDFPAVQKFVAQYKGQGVAFYAVNAGEQPGAVRRFVTQHPLESTVLLDPHNKATAALHVQQLPAVAIIAPDNTVVAILQGAAKDLQQDLAARLSDLIANRARTTARRPEAPAAK